MSLKSEISIQAAKMQGAKYDAAAKEVFMNPEIIAPVLQGVVPEYRNSSVDEIISYIDRNSIKDEAIDDVSIAASLLPTEMSSISDKLVRYDIHFTAYNPTLSAENIKVFMHIDLEVQNTYKPTNPSYPIIKRGIYYGAREISSQLGILTNETNYGKLQKVYSIWICNEDVPNILQNTITSYSITKKDEVGITDEPNSDYDLMTVILIRRGKKDSNVAVLDYLNGVFSSDIDKMCKYVNIIDNETVMKGVRAMSGLGQTIIDNTIISTLLNLVRKGLLSVSDAAKEADMTEEEFKKLLKEKQE